MATKLISLVDGYQLLPNRLVKNVYVIEAKGTIFYKHYSDMQYADVFDSHMFSGFVAAIQSFAREIGEQEAKEIVLGNRMLYCAMDAFSGMIFVVECDPKSKPKKIRQILEKIKSIFVNSFLGNFYAEETVKSKIVPEFRKKLNETVFEPSIVGDFLSII